MFDVVAAWFALFGVVATAIRAFAAGKWPDILAGCLYMIGGAGFAVFAIGKFLVQWKRHEDVESVHDLEGCLIVLHTLLMLSMKEEDRDRVRVRFALHRPDEEAKRLVQVTNYVGDDGLGGKAGRSFAINAGIIGLAIRENRGISASRKTDNYAEYFNDLQVNWGYSKQDARLRDPQSMAWVAIPIGNPIEGVLYRVDATRLL